MVLHIPHSSSFIPLDIREEILLNDEQLAMEINEYSDTYTDELYTYKIPESWSAIIYPVNRYVADPERFVDDEKEPMAKHGLGVIYTSTIKGEILRKTPDSQQRKRILDTYYHPHHKALFEAVKSEFTKKGHSLLIDCHSFPSVPFVFEENQDKTRPDICLGTDSFHTPLWLKEKAEKLFSEAGYSVDFDFPFKGCLVPLTYYHKEKKVYSLMIEINRKLYMNEATVEKNAGFNILKKKLSQILTKLNHSVGL